MQATTTIDISDPLLDTQKEVLVNITEDKVSAALLFPDSQYVSVAIEIIRKNAEIIRKNPLLIDQKIQFFGSDALYSDLAPHQRKIKTKFI